MPNGKHSAKQTYVTAVAHDEHVRRLCRVPAPRHSAYPYFAECHLFAERRHSVNMDYGVCLWFAECWVPGTRQRGSLPSARVVALGKPSGTRHITGSGSVRLLDAHQYRSTNPSAVVLHASQKALSSSSQPPNKMPKTPPRRRSSGPGQLGSCGAAAAVVVIRKEKKRCGF